MKRLLAALLCVVMVFALLPASAYAYTDTSNRGAKLEEPEAGNYFKSPFWCRLFKSDYIEAMYIMPQPEKGHGNLGSVMTGSRVFVLGEQDGFFFFMTTGGQRGWAWHEWFDYDKELVSLKKADADDDAVLYATVSTRGFKLRMPSESDYLDEARTATVKTKTPCGSIYLMPKPSTGHGNLGTVACGEEVTILAEQDGFCFFQTEDGRYGWNGEKWFK